MYKIDLGQDFFYSLRRDLFVSQNHFKNAVGRPTIDRVESG